MVFLNCFFILAGDAEATDDHEQQETAAEGGDHEQKELQGEETNVQQVRNRLTTGTEKVD